MQSDVAMLDVPIATSFAYLVRILSQTFMSSIYRSDLKPGRYPPGVKTNHGVTMGMLNQLTNSETAGSLPSALLPTMRHILYTGMHNIMVTGLGLVLIIVVLLAVLLRRQHAQAVARVTN